MYRALYTQEKYPQGHPDLAQSMNNLATFLKVQGEYAKAEPLGLFWMFALQGKILPSEEAVA
jgi:hypothetical protein